MAATSRFILPSGERVTGDALVGADGVHSVIRTQLFGGNPTSFTGCMAWRGLIPVDRLPPRFARNVGVNWVGPGGHVINYLLRRGELFNFVGIVERDDWRVESWTEKGTREECAADFRGWHQDIHELIRNIEQPYKWALLGREPLGRCSSRPRHARSATPRIRHCRCWRRGPTWRSRTAWCWRAACRPMTASRTRLRAIIGRAVGARRSWCAGANEMAKRFHNPALANAAGAKAYVDAQWSEETVKQRYDWIFEYDATQRGDLNDDTPAAASSHHRDFCARFRGAGLAVALRRRHDSLRREIDLPAAGRIHGARASRPAIAVLDAEHLRGLADDRRSAIACCSRRCMCCLRSRAPRPSFRANDAVTFAYLFVGGLGIILYFRDRGWHAAGALVAALAFAFGGAASARLQHTGQVMSLAYLPVALWLLARALERSSARYGVLAGIAGALIVLGRDQVALLEVYVLAGFVVWHWCGAGFAARMRASVKPLIAGGIVGFVIIVAAHSAHRAARDRFQPAGIRLHRSRARLAASDASAVARVRRPVRRDGPEGRFLGRRRLCLERALRHGRPVPRAEHEPALFRRARRRDRWCSA